MDARPNQRWYRLVHDVYLFLDANENQVLSEFDLTSTAYRALLLLDTKEPKNLVTLSNELWCARSTVTRLVEKMENEKLVRRITDPNNRRAHLVTLTPAGVQLREQARTAHRQMLSDVLDVLAEPKKQQMIRMFDKVRSQLLDNLEHSNGA